MAGAVLPLSWGRASVLYSVQRFCMLSGGAPFVARLRFMFLLGFPLPHYPFLWPLPLFLFYISREAYDLSTRPRRRVLPPLFSL